MGHFGKYIRNNASSEMWYWRKMAISWTERVRNEEVLHRIKDEWNILQTTKRKKANWIGRILLSKTCYGRKDRGTDRSDGRTRKKT